MDLHYSPEHRRYQPPFCLKGLTGGERPHPETPERAETIRETLAADGFTVRVVDPFLPVPALRRVHSQEYLAFFEAFAALHPGDGPVYPDSFVPRRSSLVPSSVDAQYGYFCTDTETPLGASARTAALASAACAHTAARQVADGARAAYALCRPPGHHAGRDYFGGYCFLNNAAVAAALLSGRGRVAVLDVDYHHGNGTQDIFYDSDRVLFVSVHADTNAAYPYFSGTPEETGTGRGLGFTRNFPVSDGEGVRAWTAAAEAAVDTVRAVGPEYLVVSFGADTYARDPVGGSGLEREDYARLGALVADLGLPTVIVQEGGYDVEALPILVREFLTPFRRQEP